MKLRMTNSECRIERGPRLAAFPFVIHHSSFVIRRAFTLVEVMVVVVLLSLIVYALMMVFSSTQAAFRASVTQAGVLDDGRAAMDLMASDLRAMAPSDGNANYAIINNTLSTTCAVNFYAFHWNVF